MPLDLAIGYRRCSAAPGTRRFRPPAGLELAADVDLREWCTPVENQGRLSSCTANACVGLYEYTGNVQAEGQGYADLSRLFVYWNARVRGGTQNEDGGSVIQYAMESLAALGTCEEIVWPYVEQRVNHRPSEDAFRAAARLKVQPKDIRQVPQDLDAWRACLSAGLPIVFGCTLFESFDECCLPERAGVVPMPDPADVGRAEHGGHAMLCVGYSDYDEVFIVRNSWGSDWGIEGNCFMPYNYLMSPEFGADDAWTLDPTRALPAPARRAIATSRGRASGGSILNNGAGVPFPTNPYPAGSYEGFRSVVFERVEEYEEPPEEFVEVVHQYAPEVDLTVGGEDDGDAEEGDPWDAEGAEFEGKGTDEALEGEDAGAEENGALDGYVLLAGPVRITTCTTEGEDAVEGEAEEGYEAEGSRSAPVIAAVRRPPFQAVKRTSRR
ncbi:hypothetical protein DFJ74DRAFT_724722 [Hyaloraphidium curvatum]|nr:hypothetical protein DFJ74DRAFT_724722 [Hyaloraphidium curvatum]